MLSWLRTPRTDFAPPAPGALRVVIEVRSFDKGGLEKVVFDTARLFDRTRFAPLIVSTGPLGDYAVRARRAGIRAEALPRRDPLGAYAALLDAYRPDLAVAHFSSMGYDLFTQRGIPTINVIHNVYAFLNDEQRRKFIAEDAQVAHHISVSANATRYATARLGIAPARITTIPNGLDIAEYDRLAAAAPMRREKLGISPDDYVFLNVAAYNMHKGHHLMAAAMRALLARRSDIRVVCVGNVVVPAHVQALRSRLRQDGLERHMLLPGYTAHVEEMFAMADAFLLPSFIEGWSIAMNEAMAFGKPLLLTDTGGAREVIDGDDIGLVIRNEYGETTALDCALLDRLAYDTWDFRTAADLAEAMERFAGNRAIWAEAGARGREKLRTHYDLREMVRRHEAAMLTVAARAAA